MLFQKSLIDTRRSRTKYEGYDEKISILKNFALKRATLKKK